jgi:hypothetical protein
MSKPKKLPNGRFQLTVKTATGELKVYGDTPEEAQRRLDSETKTAKPAKAKPDAETKI